jgi:hypothetical protein
MAVTFVGQTAIIAVAPTASATTELPLLAIQLVPVIA